MPAAVSGMAQVMVPHQVAAAIKILTAGCPVADDQTVLIIAH
jgi:hypothetical protein